MTIFFPSFRVFDCISDCEASADGDSGFSIFACVAGADISGCGGVGGSDISGFCGDSCVLGERAGGGGGGDLNRKLGCRGGCGLVTLL